MSIRRMMLFTLGGFFKSIISLFKTRVLNDGGTFEAETNLENQLNTLGSTLFDSASLVITPSGVKTSKLYSIKPSDGTGDLSVVRNTSATRIDENGNIVNVSANVARIDYSTGQPAILVEPQMTNIWANNNNTNGYLNNNKAIKQNIVSDAFGIGFNGFQYSFVGGETFLSSNYNIKTFDTRNLPIQRLSIIIKNPSSDFLGISFSGVEDVRFKFSTLEVSRPNNAYIKKINSDTYIIYIYTNVATGLQFSQVRVGFVQSLTSSTTVNGSCILGLGFAQGLSSGSLPNYDYLPIITNTGSVTRNADVISNTNVSTLIGQTEGTILIKGAQFNRGSVFRIRNNTNTSVNRMSIFGIDTGGNVEVGVMKNNVSVSTVYYLNVKKKNIIMVYSQNIFKVFINGQLIYQYNYPISTDFTAVLNTVEFGSLSENGTANFDFISLWKTQITDTQAIQLTTL